MKPRITAATPPDLWPQYLTASEVALVLGLAVHTIQNRCSLGTMVPPPILNTRQEYQRPLRWRREIVRRACEGKAA